LPKKIISVTIPCYKEENSIFEMYERLLKVLQALPQYDYELIFVDDCSPDATWSKIEEICSKDKRVKGVHNATNFGPVRNIFQTIKYGTGDAVFLLMGDLQEPPERLPEFVKYWEEGYAAVLGVHPNTRDKGIAALCRKAYYKMMNIVSGNKIIQNFAYYGLYAGELVKTLRKIDDMLPFFPGLIA